MSWCKDLDHVIKLNPISSDSRRFYRFLLCRNGPSSVKVFWPDPATNTYTLRQNANPATTNWVASGYTMTNGFDTNFVTITPLVWNLFFRLKQ